MIETKIPTEFLKVEPERDNFVIDICRNKKVLHIGATDHPFTEEKYKQNQLLYTKLSEVVAEQIGIDNDASSSEFLNSKNIKNSRIEVFDMNAVTEFSFKPDVIVFGETLEHLMNLETSLSNLKKLMSENTLMIISVPNALSFLSVLYAAFRRELQHPDHSVAFTFRTLTQLLKKNRLEVVAFRFAFLDNTNAVGLNWKGKIGHLLVKTMVKVSPLFAPTLVAVVKNKSLI